MVNGTVSLISLPHSLLIVYRKPDFKKFYSIHIFLSTWVFLPLYVLSWLFQCQENWSKKGYKCHCIEPVSSTNFFECYISGSSFAIVPMVCAFL